MAGIFSQNGSLRRTNAHKNSAKSKRAETKQDTTLQSTSALQLFLDNNYTLDDFKSKANGFEAFTQLDDFDILASIKEMAKPFR